MKKIWHALTHIGVNQNLDSLEARRISYVNYIVLLTALYLFTRILFSLSNIVYCIKLFSSHELRTPLNAILGFSELMQRDPDVSKEQQQNLETIGRSGVHLLSLINDVLEFSKIEAGRAVLNSEDFDLNQSSFQQGTGLGLSISRKFVELMDGYEATAIIRSKMQRTGIGTDTTIIALTANAFEQDHLKVIEHGCDDFVRKPFRESEIFEMLHKHLGVRYVFKQEKNKIPVSRIGDMADDQLTVSLKELPEDLLSRLEEATELSDSARIERVIREIATKDGRLSGVLSRLAADFAYDEILALIQMT